MNTNPDCVKNYIDVVPDFPKPGVNFLDINPLLADSRALYHVIADMCSLSKGDIDKIGGFDARGFLFGTPMMLRMHKPFFPIRKAGKLPGETVRVDYGLEYGKDSIEVQLASVKPGDKVLLVDDVLATGGTMLAGIEAIESLGGIIVGCIFLAELNFLPGPKLLRDKGYVVKSIVQYDE